jgi:Predicted transcriptional regulator
MSETSKDEFISHLTKVVRGAIKETERAHGAILPDSVAKRIAAQLWGDTRSNAHKDPQKWIRHVRSSLGVTQTEFANMLGTNQVTVARWETGVSNPSPYYRKAIEDVARRLKSD